MKRVRIKRCASCSQTAKEIKQWAREVSEYARWLELTEVLTPDDAIYDQLRDLAAEMVEHSLGNPKRHLYTSRPSLPTAEEAKHRDIP